MARLLIKKYRSENADERRYYWWRLLVKQRLYKRSRDILIQLDSSDRIQKLDETVDNVEDGYEALIGSFTEREKALEERQKQEENEGNGTKESQPTAVLDVSGQISETEKGIKRKATETSNGEDVAGSSGEAAKRPKA